MTARPARSEKRRRRSLWRAFSRFLGHPPTGGIFCTADAGMPGGPAAACPAVASGIMVMPISNRPGDQLVWFRPEFVRTVTWAGDPHKPVEIGQTERISPRKILPSLDRTAAGPVPAMDRCQSASCTGT